LSLLPKISIIDNWIFVHIETCLSIPHQNPKSTRYFFTQAWVIEKPNPCLVFVQFRNKNHSLPYFLFSLPSFYNVALSPSPPSLLHFPYSSFTQHHHLSPPIITISSFSPETHHQHHHHHHNCFSHSFYCCMACKAHNTRLWPLWTTFF